MAVSFIAGDQKRKKKRTEGKGGVYDPAGERKPGARLLDCIQESGEETRMR